MEVQSHITYSAEKSERLDYKKRHKVAVKYKITSDSSLRKIEKKYDCRFKTNDENPKQQTVIADTSVLFAQDEEDLPAGFYEKAKAEFDKYAIDMEIMTKLYDYKAYIATKNDNVPTYLIIIADWEYKEYTIDPRRNRKAEAAIYGPLFKSDDVETLMETYDSYYEEGSYDGMIARLKKDGYSIVKEIE